MGNQADVIKVLRFEFRIQFDIKFGHADVGEMIHVYLWKWVVIIHVPTL